MIKTDIPGSTGMVLNYLVLDYNGTIALDGELIEGVEKRLINISRELEIHVLTADTFGGVTERLSGIPCKVHILEPRAQDIGKLNYIKQLGAEQSVAIGNGRNDTMMLSEAALGIAVIQGEGASKDAVFAADIVVPDILSALDLISNPLRLIATLRV